MSYAIKFHMFQMHINGLETRPAAEFGSYRLAMAPFKAVC